MAVRPYPAATVAAANRSFGSGRSSFQVIAIGRILALTAQVDEVAVAATSASPMAGALLDAIAEGGLTLDAAVHDRVLRTSHPLYFLLT